MGTKDQKCIKPSSSLIDTFRDEITGERSLKQVLVLEGVVCLGIRHATWLEPTIENFFDALEIAFPLLWGDGDVVDAFAMKIGDAFYAWKSLEFLYRPDTDDLLGIESG